MLKLLMEKEHLLNVEAVIVKLVCKLLISDAQLELERQNWGRRPLCSDHLYISNIQRTQKYSAVMY